MIELRNDFDKLEDEKEVKLAYNNDLIVSKIYK